MWRVEASVIVMLSWMKLKNKETLCRCETVCERLVVVVSVLDVGDMSTFKDLSNWSHNWVRDSEPPPPPPGFSFLFTPVSLFLSQKFLATCFFSVSYFPSIQMSVSSSTGFTSVLMSFMISEWSCDPIISTSSPAPESHTYLQAQFSAVVFQTLILKQQLADSWFAE